MKSFIKLTLAFIALTTIFTGKVTIHPIDGEAIKIKYVSTSPFPIIRIHGQDLPMLHISFSLPSLDGYNWRAGNIAISISGYQSAFCTIPQSDLDDLFLFFGDYYEVERKGATLYFSDKDIDTEEFVLRRWSSGQKLLKYLHQERALFGYLTVLLDCESYMGKSIRKISVLRTGINPTILSEVLDNKCKDAEIVSEYLINDTTRALRKLLEEVFEHDAGQEIAQERVKVLVEEVKLQIEDEEDDYLVFLA
jgi:hypothetical protein